MDYIGFNGSATSFNLLADLRFKDADGSHYVGFQAPSSVGTNLVWTLPASDGAANRVLKTDGSGNLSFAEITNAYVASNAAIAGTKISPDFGSQNIVTTGTAATGALSITGNLTVSGTVDGVDIATRDTLFGGLTASSGVLTDGVSATTQTASDNTTKVATTAYVTTAVNNLINGAPAALDTLNELAAAMNDDAAFSTTVTNNLATKLALAGGQMTGNITFSGSQTVDGRDLSVDGAKLDGGIMLADGDKGDITVSNSGATFTIDSGVVTSAKIASSTIATSNIADDAITSAKILANNVTTSEIADDAVTSAKIMDGTIIAGNLADEAVQTLKIADNSVTSAKITNGTILNIDVNASAAIAGTKISPAFGSQAISTTGALGCGDITMTDVSPAINFTDSDGSQNYQIRLNSGILKFKDTTNGAERMQINADGHVDVLGNLDVGSGLDVTGAITATGLLALGGNLTITNSFPKIDLVKDSTSYQINNENGVFNIRQNDTTNKIQINTDGHVDITAHLDAEGGVDVTGNITVTGTVDGVDIATRDTLFGGLTASSGVLTNGVTATTQSASDNSTKVATTAYADAAISNATITGSQISTNAISTNKIADSAVTTAKIADSAVTTAKIADDAITTAKLAADAVTASELSNNIVDDNKLTSNAVTTAKIADSAVTSAKIANATIVNADISGSAAIDGTKISPDFGAQNIQTNGTITSNDISTGGNITISNSAPAVNFTDTSDNPDYQINIDSGTFNIRDTTNSINRLVINTDGHVDIDGNVDFSAGIDVTGAITGTGDVTIDTSTFKVDSSNNRVGVGTASPTDLLDIHTTTNNQRLLRLSHPSSPTAACAFIGYNDDGTGTTNNIVTFGIQTSSTYYNVLNIRRSTQTVGINKLIPTEALDVTGNIAVSGTVDGVDIAALNSTVSGKLSNIVEDTSPQLGGDLDMNSKFISSGILGIKNTGSQSEVRLYCESSNAHYAAVQAPAHSVFSGNVTLTLPAAAGNQSLVGTTETQTLTNKTLTSAVLNTGVSGSAILDEDNMASNSATQLATQQSIKAYVDANAGGGGGTPGGSNTQVQFNNSGSFGGSSNLTFDGTNLTVGGTVSGTSSASGTAGFRKITASTSAPSGGSDGDVWIKYTA